MAYPLCPVCCELFEHTPDGTCSNCGANFRIRIEIRPGADARLAEGSTVRPVEPAGVERAIPASLVDPFDSPRCPRCGGEVDPAQWACMPCGWMGFDKYAA
jgi:hypothetical protein